MSVVTSNHVYEIRKSTQLETTGLEEGESWMSHLILLPLGGGEHED